MPNAIIAYIMMAFTGFLGMFDIVFGTDFAQNGVLYINEISSVVATKLAEILYKFLGIFI